MELDEETKKLYEQMKESGYDMFDINDPFYQDICTPFDSENGTDVLLTDRINDIYNNENTQCQSNCQLSYYNAESKYLNCTCSASEETASDNYEVKDKFTAKKIYESFYDVLKYSNYKIIKCFNIISDINVITKNIGSIIIIGYFVFYSVCCVCYIAIWITPLKKKLLNELKNNTPVKLDINNYLNPPNKKKPTRKLVLREDIKSKTKAKKDRTKTKRHLNTRNKTNDKIQIFSHFISSKGNLDISPSEKSGDLKIKEIFKYNKKETENEQNIKYSDFELNELKYSEAINLDKRTLLQTYWAVLRREHLIIFTFINCNDYNLLSIKLTRFIFLVATDMALNVIFFSDDSMHKLYLNYGKYDFVQQIPKITYSTIISQLIEVFLCFLSLTDKHIYRIKSFLIKGKMKKIKKIIKCMKIKLIIFFSFTSVFFIAYWYVISVFCGVYRNTQMTFIKDSALSFSITLVYPFALYLLSSSLRICALRDSRKRFKCIYSLSDIIPFF